jgi:hypothetical protein
MDRSSSLWAKILEILLPLAALGLCAWAMDGTRGKRLPGGGGTDALATEGTKTA